MVRHSTEEWNREAELQRTFLSIVLEMKRVINLTKGKTEEEAIAIIQREREKLIAKQD